MRSDNDLDPLLGVPEVAIILGLSKKGVYGLVERGAIPFVRISNRVRFSRHEIAAYIEARRMKKAC